MQTNQTARSKWMQKILAKACFCVILALCILPTQVHADGGFPIIGALHAGSRPEGIAVDTSTHMVYIFYEEYPARVVALDGRSDNVRWSAVVAADTVTDIQVDGATHRVYAAGSLFKSRQGLLTILDGASGRTLLAVKTPASDDALAFDPRRQRAYVASIDGQRIFAIHVTMAAGGALAATTSTLLAGPRPQALGVNSLLGRLYVGDIARNTVAVYSEDSGQLLAVIPVAAMPLPPLRVDEATGRVYVVCSLGQELDIINGNNNSVLAHIPVSPYPEGVAFNTWTGRIYVADEGNNEGNPNAQQIAGTTITVIDGQSFAVLGTLQIGRSPNGVEADPLLRRIYIAAEDSGAVVVLSDSVGLPLKMDANFHQAAAVQLAMGVLQQATVVTFLLMLLTMIGASLAALLPRWRARGSPQSLPGDVSSHSEMHSPPL
jgi:DNA-binding beta-propeller fold protein YncE